MKLKNAAKIFLISLIALITAPNLAFTSTIAGIGLHSGSPTAAPVQIPGLYNVTTVVGTSDNHYALRTDGTVWYWKKGTSSATPTDLSNVITLESVGSYFYAIKSDGTVWYREYSWGSSLTSPSKQVPGLSNIIAVSEKSSGCLYALRSDGTVWHWRNTSAITSAVQVPGMSNITAISVYSHSYLYALKSDGTVWFWNPGYWHSGWGVSTPAIHMSGLSSITAIVGLSDSLYALRSDGTVWTRSTISSDIPRHMLGMSNITAIMGSYNYIYALRTDGTVWYRHRNWAATTPAAQFPISNVIAILGTTYDDYYALKSDRTVWFWDYYAPIQVSGLSDILAIKLTGITSPGLSAIKEAKLSIASLTCSSSSLYLGQQTSCNAVIDNPHGDTITSTWSVENSANGSSGGVVVTTGGTVTTPTATVKPTTTQEAKVVKLTVCASGGGCVNRTFPLTILTNDISATLTGDTKILANNDGLVHVSTASRTWGTLIYTWSVSSGTKTDISPVSPNLSSVRVRSSVNPLIVTARISLVEDPSFFITRTHQIEVVVPDITINSMTCPTEINYGQSISCSIDVTAQAINNAANFTWSGSGLTFSNKVDTNTSSQVNVNFTPGAAQISVTAQACLRDAPTVCKSQSKNVKINYDLSIDSLVCPSEINYGQQVNCSAVVNTSSAVNFTWGGQNTSFSNKIDTNTSSQVDVNFTVGVAQADVTLQACLKDVPSVCRSQTKSVKINYQAPEISSLICPSSLVLTKEGECDAVVSAYWGTIKPIWSSNGTITPIGIDSAKIVFTSPISGNGTVTYKACLNEVPSVCSTKSANITVESPTLTVLSFTCPSELTKRTQGECSIVATATHGFDLKYKWNTSVDGTITESAIGNKVDVLYTTVGEKNIVVTVEIDGIASIKTTRSNKILSTGVSKPSLSFTGATAVNRGQPMILTGNGSSNFGAVNLSWIIDDKVTTGNTFEHVFTTPGSVYITLKGVIAGYEGDPDAETTIPIRVYVRDIKKPYVVISGQRTGEVGIPIILKADVTSEIPFNAVWTLPNDATVDGATLEFTPEQQGESILKFTAYPPTLPDFATTIEVKITARKYEMPTPDIKLYTPESGIAPFTVVVAPKGNFSEALSFPNNFLLFKWDMGDGAVKEVLKPNSISHQYLRAGIHTITLTVKDNRGNEKIVTRDITVKEPPPLVVENLRVIKSNKFNREPLTVVVKPTITGGNPKYDRISEYRWTVNGQTVEKPQKIQAFRLDTAGQHVITLTAVSATGKTATENIIIDVIPNQPPTCDISYVNYPLAKLTRLISLCKDLDGKIQSYLWDLGNGETSQRGSLYVPYKSSGVYNVKLKATDDSGAEVFIEKPITVAY